MSHVLSTLTLPSPALQERDHAACMVSQTARAPHSKRFIRTTLKARALRKDQTPSEKLLWKKLRGRKFHNLKFRRQVPLGPFIVDFYCAEHRLVIEVDGCVHALKKQYDGNRQRFIEEGRFTVLRFTNVQVNESISWVLSQIASSILTRRKATAVATAGGKAPPSPIRWERAG